MSFCLSATWPQYELKDPHFHNFSRTLRQTKQNSVLQKTHFICLHPSLCSIDDLQFGQSRCVGTSIVIRLSLFYDIKVNFFVPTPYQNVFVKEQLTFPQSSSDEPLHFLRQIKQNTPNLHFLFEQSTFDIPWFESKITACLQPGHIFVCLLSQF